MATKRASGETGGAEVAKELAKDLDNPEPEEPLAGLEDRRTFRTPGFQRLRTAWNRDDAMILAQAQDAVERKIIETFVDAYQLMNEVFDIVRTPETGPDGEPRRDQHGYIVWKRGLTGGYDEDFSRLTLKQKEDLLFKITTRLFDWEQRAVNLWGEAMFARAQWEERFAIDYDTPITGTIDDRTAAARRGAADERYFAIYVTLLSRKADAVVRTLSLLGQRLKDSMV